MLSATIVLVTASTPAKLGYDLQKGLLWTSPAGMFVWLVLGWAIAAVTRPYLAQRSHWAERLRRARSGGRIGCGDSDRGGRGGGAGAGSDSNGRWYQPVRTIVSRVAARLPHNGVTLVDARGDFNGFSVQTALIYQLRKRGYRVVASNGYLALVPKLGADYDPCRHLPDRTLLVADDGSPLPHR